MSFLKLLFCCVLPALANAAPSGQTLKVLSLNFNAEVFFTDKDGFWREQRYARILDWIHRNDPDVIAIQEAWEFRSDPLMAVTLARDIGYDLAYSLDMGVPGLFYNGNAILAKKSLHLSDEVDTVLPHSAFFTGDRKKTIFITGAVTVAVGAVLHPDGSPPIYVYTSHLVGGSVQERSDQMVAMHKAILGHLAKNHDDWNSTRVMIMGDFNDDGTAPTIQFPRSQGYVDTWDLAHPDLVDGEKAITNCGIPTSRYFLPLVLGAGQFPSQTGPGGLYCNRIDWLMAHAPDFKVLASTMVFTGPYRGLWMSDHTGVFSTIAFDGAAEPPAPLPNPPRDYAQPLPYTKFLKITGSLIKCDTIFPDEGCTKRMPDLTAHMAPGFTLMNYTHTKLAVHVRGPGTISSYPDAGLKPGDPVAFSFSRPGEYSYVISNSEDKIYVKGALHVIQ
jgi:endonuclease/exonuclease/phosphatase family metal-dependent hydrolase